MRLSPSGREWYTLEISTTPAVTGWDASFDGGATWVASTAVGSDGYYRWLVAGPSATDNPAGTTVLPLNRTQPKIRASANPELIIRGSLVPYIEVRDDA